MTDLERIEKLIDAGFSADEIRSYFSTTDEPAGAESSNSSESDNAEEDATGAPAESSGESPNKALMEETAKWLKDIKASLDSQMSELKKQMEAVNMSMLRNQEEVSKGSYNAFMSLTNPPGIVPGVKEGEK